MENKPKSNDYVKEKGTYLGMDVLMKRLPKLISESDKLTEDSKKLYAFLLDLHKNAYKNEDGYNPAKNELLASACGFGNSTHRLMNAIRQLTSYGLIETIRGLPRRKGEKTKPSLYKINFERLLRPLEELTFEEMYADEIAEASKSLETPIGTVMVTNTITNIKTNTLTNIKTRTNMETNIGTSISTQSRNAIDILSRTETPTDIQTSIPTQSRNAIDTSKEIKRGIEIDNDTLREISNRIKRKESKVEEKKDESKNINKKKSLKEEIDEVVDNLKIPDFIDSYHYEFFNHIKNLVKEKTFNNKTEFLEFRLKNLNKERLSFLDERKLDKFKEATTEKFLQALEDKIKALFNSQIEEEEARLEEVASPCISTS